MYILPDQEKALFILEGFAFMEKLKMTMALLPDEDVVRINRVITALEESNAVDSSRIHAVRRLFSI